MHRLLRLLPVLALALTLSACDSSDSDPNDLDCAQGTLTATADGSAYEARCIILSVEGSVISIASLSNPDGQAGSTQRQFNLNVIGTAAGTYSPPIGAVLVYTDARGTAQNQIYTTTATSGQITLTEVSATHVRGTFQFSGPEFQGATQTGRTVSVTNGQFDIQR